MKKCQNCGEAIEWDTYWTTWDHSNRAREMTAELCHPEQGFDESTIAVPERSTP